MKAKRQVQGLISLIFLLVLSSLSTVHAQTLEGIVWQLQNPKDGFISKTIFLNPDGVFYSRTLNLNTDEIEEEFIGSYFQTDSTLRFSFDDSSHLDFEIFWVNCDKIALKNGRALLILAKEGSDEDHLLRHYIASKNKSPNVRSNNMFKNKICTNCNNTRKCTFCKGNSILIYRDIQTVCTYCNGSGVCRTCSDFDYD